MVFFDSFYIWAFCSYCRGLVLGKLGGYGDICIVKVVFIGVFYSSRVILYGFKKYMFTLFYGF